MTPLEVFNCLTTDMEIEQAKMGTEGLYLATNLAILPVSVNTMIRSMFKSKTVYTAAEATASAVDNGTGV